jgi:hypothetical protein
VVSSLRAIVDVIPIGLRFVSHVLGRPKRRVRHEPAWDGSPGWLGLCSLLCACGGDEEESVELGPNFQGIRALTPKVEELTEARRNSATLHPATSVAAAVGDFTLRVQLRDGLSVGGRVLVEFPKSWFPHPWPRGKRLQVVEPNAPHYLAVAPASKLTFSWENYGLSGKHERFQNLIEILPREALPRGTVVTVSWSQTTAPYISGRDEVLVAVNSGDGLWELHRAEYNVEPGAVRSIRLTAQSNAVVGETIELSAVALDQFDNVAVGYETTATVEGTGEPLVMKIREGRGKVLWRPRAAGFHWPELIVPDSSKDLGQDRNRVAGNPVWVTDLLVEDRIYWGDLHSHSRISMDGIGKADFLYARDVSQLDFFASTEHADDDPFSGHDFDTRDGITPDEWLDIRQKVQDFYVPGDFVTLLGYECSLPQGHHNVYFGSLDGVPSPTHQVLSIGPLWRRVKAAGGFSIPHHTGKRPAHTVTEIDGPGLQPLGDFLRPAAKSQAHEWGVLNSGLRRTPLIEIYSSHGSSELYSPADPLSYESVRYSGAISEPGPHYAQDAWAAGHHLGVVASSDNHVAHPGRPDTGLTALMAPDLTREAVFHSLRARRSYGTTGERMILDFRFGGAKMGERLSASSVGQLQSAEVLVVAPREIAFVEILSFRKRRGWKVVERWSDVGKILEDRTEAIELEVGLVLYVRAELKENGGRRTARAWSSPIRVVE